MARILLADDHCLFAEALRSLLIRDFELLDVVLDGHALVAKALLLQPDVILTDITMPGLNGLEAMAELRRQGCRSAFVFVTMHNNAAYARHAFEAGAMGYVLKHSAPAELVEALRAALKGNVFITPSITNELRAATVRRQRQAKELTPRQVEILKHLARGGSAKEIAAALSISPRTVEFHKYQIMGSTGLHTTAELTQYAIRCGIVEV